MKLKSRLFTSRKIVLGAAAFLSLVSIAAAEAPYTNPFERSAFGDDWGILSNDIFFGGAYNLFGLSPASRTLLLTDATESETKSDSTAIVNAARSSENLFSFASSLSAPFAVGRGFGGSVTGPNAPNAVTAVVTWDANGASGGNAWLTANNWNPDTVPGAADTATFADTAGSTSININFGSSTNNGLANQIVGAIALTGGELRTISNSSATAGTLTIDGVGGVLLSNSSAFDLTLQNGAGVMTVALPNAGSIDVTSTGNIIISSSVTGAAALTKTGAGTLILSGSNLYSGGTTVSDGTLLVNNTGGSGTGSGVINVNTGGTLGGTGTILAGSNNVTIDSGGTITGATNGSVGNLTLSANTLSISGTFLADIMGSAADSLILTGNLVLAPGSTLDFNTLAAPTAPLYTLLSYTGTISGTFIAVDTPLGYEVQYNPQSIDLVLVPEPGTWIGAALALAAIGFTQRRRLRGLIVRHA